MDVSVSSSSSDLALVINDSRGKQLAREEGNQNLKHRHTAAKAGSVQVCVNSNSNTDVEYKFALTTGVDSKDYTNLINA